MDDSLARGFSSDIPSALRRAAWFSGGKSDALQFAVKCQGNAGQIQAEIQRVEEMISEIESVNPDGPMSPRAGPRIYKDGYLEGLREALDIILSSEQ